MFIFALQWFSVLPMPAKEISVENMNKEIGFYLLLCDVG